MKFKCTIDQKNIADPIKRKVYSGREMHKFTLSKLSDIQKGVVVMFAHYDKNSLERLRFALNTVIRDRRLGQQPGGAQPFMDLRRPSNSNRPSNSENNYSF